MLRTFRFLMILSTLALTHCARPGYESTGHGSTPYETGGKTQDGRKFVVGAEERLPDEVIKITPFVPAKKTPEEEKRIAFHESLKQFRFLRYNQGDQKPARLGNYSYRLDIRIQAPNSPAQVVSFHGQFKSQGTTLSFKNTSSTDKEYSIAGDLNPLENSIEGKFTLTQNIDGKSKEEATILYRAYEAELDVATPHSKNIEEHVNLAKKIDRLKSNTSAWINDFVVPLGVSAFDVSIIRKISDPSEADSWESLLSFSGRSVETDSEVSSNIETTRIFQQFDDRDFETIELIGNAEGEDSKLFAIKMKDDKGEDTEILINVERQKTAAEIKAEQEETERFIKEELERPLPPPDDLPRQAPTTPLSISADLIAEDPTGEEFPIPDIKNIPIPGVKPIQSPGNNSKSYLFVSHGANALKIIRDFDATLSLKKVQNEIKALRRKSAGIKAFFKYAHPFRGLIKAIAAAYDVPPQFAYITVIESAYFTGGKYKIQVSKAKKNGHYYSTATGPFQLIYGTARGMGMRVLKNAVGQMPGNSDERKYFAPSACGAAKYFRYNAKLSRDKALAIFAYNQGEGRAAQVAKEYGYRFAKISKLNIDGARYANKKLAAYFIAGAYQGSAYDVDDQAPKKLPRTTVFPPNAIKDSVCRNAINSI